MYSQFGTFCNKSRQFEYIAFIAAVFRALVVVARNQFHVIITTTTILTAIKYETHEETKSKSKYLRRFVFQHQFFKFNFDLKTTRNFYADGTVLIVRIWLWEPRA